MGLYFDICGCQISERSDPIERQNLTAAAVPNLEALFLFGRSQADSGYRRRKEALLKPSRIWPSSGPIGECSSMAELQLPKLMVRVRFPSLARQMIGKLTLDREKSQHVLIDKNIRWSERPF